MIESAGIEVPACRRFILQRDTKAEVRLLSWATCEETATETAAF